MNKSLKRISTFYVALQIIIWAKTLAFFMVYGYGKVMPFNAAAFPPEAKLFDFVFHEACHVLIGIMALAFGARMEKTELPKFSLIIFAAVAMHNFAYWLTQSHPSALYSVMDFGFDSALLGAFVIAGALLAKHPMIRQIMAPPVLEK